MLGHVVFVRPEAPRTATIRLSLDEPFGFRPGQAILIDPSQFGKSGKPRGFSCASHPGEKEFVEITVKAAGGVLAPYLIEKLRKGDKVEFTGPIGTLTLPDSIPEGIAGAVHVAAGSGVVPIRSIIRHSLHEQSGLRHLLFLQNRTEEDIIYRGEWRSMEMKHPELLKVVHALSHERKYLDLAVIGRGMEEFLTAGECLAFVCGPKGFLESVLGVLIDLGIPRERVIRENW